MTSKYISTIILTGKDAERFDKAIKNVKPVTKKELKKIIDDYNFIKDNCEVE